MGLITVKVDKKTEMRFRTIAASKFGPKRSDLEKAFTEAMNLWLDEQSHFEHMKHLLDNPKKIYANHSNREEIHSRY